METGGAGTYIVAMSWQELRLKESSSIAAAAYDRRRRTLRITFRPGRAAHRGGTYDYRPVPAAVVGEFLRAESLGRFVNGRIKPAYAYARVR